METAQRQELDSGIGFCARPTSEDQTAMLMHDMAMDANPLIAATGRASKHIINAFDQWTREEEARGTHPREITTAAISMAASLVMSSGCPQKLFSMRG